MNRTHRTARVALLAGLILISGVAGATSLQILATPQVQGLTPFTVSFMDTGDGVLQFSEITAFSGFNASPPAVAGAMTLSSILNTPSVPGLIDAHCTYAAVCDPFLWVFDPGNLVAGQTRWSYSFTTSPPAPSVPEPGSLALLGLGLAGLGLSRRRRT